MLADKLNTPEDYLAYSRNLLRETGLKEVYPKISAYYEELCRQFTTTFYDNEQTPFVKWGNLLNIDAQIQILMEFAEHAEKEYVESFGMSEEEIIQIIRKDKSTFFRELTGGTVNQVPKWGLIFSRRRRRNGIYTRSVAIPFPLPSSHKNFLIPL